MNVVPAPQAPSLLPCVSLCFVSTTDRFIHPRVSRRLKLHRRSSTRAPTTGLRGPGGQSGASTTVRAGAPPTRQPRCGRVCPVATPEGRSGQLRRPNRDTKAGRASTILQPFRHRVTFYFIPLDSFALAPFSLLKRVGRWCQVTATCTRFLGV